MLLILKMQINPREKNALASFTHSDLFQSIFYSTLKGVNVFMLYFEIDFVKRTIPFTTFSSLLDFDFIDEKLFCFYLYSYSTRYCSHRTWFCSYTQLAFVPSKFFPCWTFLCSFSTWYCTVYLLDYLLFLLFSLLELSLFLLGLILFLYSTSFCSFFFPY